MLKYGISQILRVSIIAVALFITPAFSIESAANINVMNYGAKGDGKTDDTEAIKAAMKAATIRISASSPVDTYYQAGPTLVFPCGEYVVSDEIPVTALEIRGEGRAVIRQINNDKNILVSKNAWRVVISNLTFLGGRNQVDLYNPNIESGQIIIELCQFYGASGFGVSTDVLSTTVKIKDCEFIFCHQSWCNKRSDQSIMRDCWITTGKNVEDKAAIEHRGMRLTIENLTGVTIVGSPRLRWIDHYGADITLKQCRFGGEGGGFTPVYNFRKYIKSDDTAFDAAFGANILIDNCFVAAGSTSNANCAVFCVEVPNFIKIENTVLHNCSAVIVDKKNDVYNYFENVDPGRLNFSILNCTGAMRDKLPDGLRKPVITYKKEVNQILSKEETMQALDLARKEWSVCKDEPLTTAAWGGHKQQTDPGKYVELAEQNSTERLTDLVGLSRVGSDTIILFRATRVGDSGVVKIRSKIDCDKYPWLTWRQKKTTAPGSFILRVVDVESKEMRTLYPETFMDEYQYHADNLKKLFGVNGVRDFEIQWIALGWEMKTPKEEDWRWAQAGQYVVLDFMRAEAD
ncbi:MAG: hypothetical protein A2Y12_05410 [Planctomycetes bacterium GWF2_42_9]|nr:MAG: hypothetical protein A2Y12_05410 [Planctomycetes bacterium GWF2_42_9]